ncbi:MAG: DNA cytosine methyltransferase [Desulfobacterales bacterium]|nr:DNA cytosine methyltransferase [Desulfobacterales bacterium]
MCGRDREKYENDPRHYLYREYLRDPRDINAPVFVMENVPGLMSSQANGSAPSPGFHRRPLAAPGRWLYEMRYELYPLRTGVTRKARRSDFVIHAEKHGVPQRRHRLDC